MSISTEQLKTLLIGMNAIKSEKYDQMARAALGKNIPLELYLPMNGLIADKHIGQIIATYYKAPFVDLNKEKIDGENLKIIPEHVARTQEAVIFKDENGTLHLATSKIDNHQFFSLIEKETGKQVKVYYTTPLAILEAIKNYKSDIKERINVMLEKMKNRSAKDDSDNSIVDVVNAIMEHAYDCRASDIHIEPLKESVIIRFRIDGVLHEIVEYPKEIHNNVVSRIKILSRLSTDEHDAAQDGRFSYGQGVDHFDVRVSILPTTGGENVVMRLLADNSRALLLEDLGMLKSDLEKIKRAASKPYGMILTAGPTGAGKTTTLYAVLHVLNRPEVNIMTIEDPVEYNVDHVRQSQVNVKKKLNFATGLRSIVRQDPDIIMVGEIRDEETADIAVNAAMTGHLLLSTLHANDAATAFPRLLDMGIEPFLLASSVNIVMAQRLARKICEKCRESYLLEKIDEITKTEPRIIEVIKKVIGKEDFTKKRVYKGKGCKSCGFTGYRGRVGLFEVMEVTEEIRTLIAKKAPSDQIANMAIEQGMNTLLDDGIQKVFQGQTTIEEVIRAIKT